MKLQLVLGNSAVEAGTFTRPKLIEPVHRARGIGDF
jgi:hypothetical protein